MKAQSYLKNPGKPKPKPLIPEPSTLNPKPFSIMRPFSLVTEGKILNTPQKPKEDPKEETLNFRSGDFD